MPRIRTSWVLKYRFHKNDPWTLSCQPPMHTRAEARLMAKKLSSYNKMQYAVILQSEAERLGLK